MSYTDKEWSEWCRTFGDTPETAKPAQAQPVTNIYVLNIDNSVNIQAVVSSGGIPAHLTDERPRLNGQLDKYLPSMYQTGNMEATARKLLGGRSR